MNITNLSTDEMELKEGSASGIAIGGLFVVGGALVGYFRHSASPIVIWIALAMVIGGIAGILLSSAITVHASKATGQIRYEKKRLLGANHATYQIADVFRIETRKQWRMENVPGSNGQGPQTQQPTLVAQSVIVFKDGRELALDRQKTSSTSQIGSAMLMSGQGGETAMAAQVAKFLNVPFQEIAPPNMGSGINIIGV